MFYGLLLGSIPAFLAKPRPVNPKPRPVAFIAIVRTASCYVYMTPGRLEFKPRGFELRVLVPSGCVLGQIKNRLGT